MNMRAMNIALPDLARQKAPLNVKDSAMTGRMYRQIATLSAICGMAFLSACSVAPEYAVPQMTLPAQYKYALSEREIVGAWQDAQPADASVRGEWWSLFDDPALNLLQDAARQANPSLQSAWARLNKARRCSRKRKARVLPGSEQDSGFHESGHLPWPKMWRTTPQLRLEPNGAWKPAFHMKPTCSGDWRARQTLRGRICNAMRRSTHRSC